jgi:hypothetical protein
MALSALHHDDHDRNDQANRSGLSHLPVSGLSTHLQPAYRDPLQHKLSRRDLAEMCLERGFALTHEAVRAWEARFAPRIADQLRTKRKGQVISLDTHMARVV